MIHIQVQRTREDDEVVLFSAGPLPPHKTYGDLLTTFRYPNGDRISTLSGLFYQLDQVKADGVKLIIEIMFEERSISFRQLVINHMRKVLFVYGKLQNLTAPVDLGRSYRSVGGDSSNYYRWRMVSFKDRVNDGIIRSNSDLYKVVMTDVPDEMVEEMIEKARGVKISALIVDWRPPNVGPLNGQPTLDYSL
jgi:hypothetical protein